MTKRLTLVAHGPGDRLLQVSIDALEAMEQAPHVTRFVRDAAAEQIEVVIDDAAAPAPAPITGVREYSLNGHTLWLDPVSGHAFYALVPPAGAVPVLVPEATTVPECNCGLAVFCGSVGSGICPRVTGEVVPGRPEP